MRNIPPFLYDHFLLNMTETWYRKVLERLDDGAVVLDIGIGTAGMNFIDPFCPRKFEVHWPKFDDLFVITARSSQEVLTFPIEFNFPGALLRCKDLVISKGLRIVGIDYNELYISAAECAIIREGMEEFIYVKCMSIYDRKRLSDLRKPNNNSVCDPQKHEVDGKSTGVPLLFDAAYFSGSFSLLPSPLEALNLVKTILKPQIGLVYITQTYQHHTPPLLRLIKPLIKYITTIDFGKLILECDVLEIFSESVFDLVDHQNIEGSVDNWFQAAFLSVLKPT